MFVLIEIHDHPGNDADRNGYGHHGYGCYGLNVGIGNIDDDPDQEILVTYDNHHIQAFNHDGVAIDAAPWFSNRDSDHSGERFTWGQFIRWADPQVEADHYHDHTGTWPHPNWAEWLQWTASPPNVVDLDLDGPRIDPPGCGGERSCQHRLGRRIRPAESCWRTR